MQHHIARIVPPLGLAPLVELSREIGRRLPGQRRVRGADALAVLAMARGARGQSARRIARVIESDGGRRRPGRRAAHLRARHRCVISGDRATGLRVERGRHMRHRRVHAPTVGIGDQLPLEIAGVAAGQARGEAAVALAVHSVAGEAGVSRPGVAAAERDQLAGGLEPVGRGRADGGAARQHGCGRGDAKLCESVHLSRGTGRARQRFLLNGRKARNREDSLTAPWRSLLPLFLLAGACKPAPEAATELSLASAERGKTAIERVGCGSCHTIGGVPWPQGKTAPALTEGMAGRALIAGELENRPDVLAAFVRDAPSLIPATTMPAMPLTRRESLDVAAYLYEIGS
jgi:mono/diheme cytochrome c family protein